MVKYFKMVIKHNQHGSPNIGNKGHLILQNLIKINVPNDGSLMDFFDTNVPIMK